MVTSTTNARPLRPLALVIEDDGNVAEVVAETLRLDSFEVVLAESIAGALRVSEQRAPDVAVVDVMLPDGSGLLLAERLRERTPDIPILFVSSLDRASDVVAAMVAGADDYVRKPFHPSELQARMRALSRRRGVLGAALWTGAGSPPGCSTGLQIDRHERHVYYGEQQLHCTALEFDLLEALAAVPGEVLSHAYLNQRLWGYSNLSDSTLLKGHVGALRRKLGAAGAPNGIIRTVYGIGYAYSPSTAA